MPGIAAILGGKLSEERRDSLGRMISCMLHETFYRSGKYHNDQLQVSIGWTSHSRGAFSGNPVWNERKDVGIILIGEHFNESRVMDPTFVLEEYEVKGTRFVEQMNGIFSGAVIDLREERVIVFNDRYGLSRIYYHEGNDGIYFSSEAKTLLKVLGKLREIDPQGLAEFCACGCVLQNRTLFSGVSLLPPASTWTFSYREGMKRSQYFRATSWEEQPRLNQSEFYEALKSTFSRILPKYFGGKESVGVALTGGLDSRMIMAWNRCDPGSVPCYTFGDTYRDCSDVAIARNVACECFQPHQVLRIDGKFLSQFPRMAEKAVYVSDGAMDVSGAVELFANRWAREIAPVRITGNYGSEILRGNIAFRPQRINESLFSSSFRQLAEKAAATYEEERRMHPLSFIAFKQVPWHHHSRLAVEQSQLTMRSPYLDNELVSLAYQCPSKHSETRGYALRLVAEGSNGLANIPTDRGLLYKPTPGLTWLKHIYDEFTFRTEYAYDYGMPQWLARIDHVLRALKPERLFLGRHKFYHFRVWYRDQLGDYIKSVLLDHRSAQRSHLNGKKLEKIVSDHVSGGKNYTSELHQALSIELIYRLLIEG